MRRFLVRIGAACLTLLIGVMLGSLHRREVNETPSIGTHSVNCPETERSEPPAPSYAPAQYPEDLPLTPDEIESFINKNPGADLKRLWERLGIREDEASSGGIGHACQGCEARSFRYNLDSVGPDEIVLRIRSHLSQSDTYLIFQSITYTEAKLLGHVDAWAKYTPQEPVVLLSGGRSWLVIQNTAATGSGLSAWSNTIYQVSSRGVRPVLTYLYELNQGGEPNWPYKRILGQLESCEIHAGRATARVSYNVMYSQFGQPTLDLFSKRQTAVLVSSLKRRDVMLDLSRSTIGPHEWETIYQIDSMGEDDFLTYNRSELRAIAIGKNRENKQWLKEFLDTCRNSPAKRELSSLIKL